MYQPCILPDAIALSPVLCYPILGVESAHPHSPRPSTFYGGDRRPNDTLQREC